MPHSLWPSKLTLLTLPGVALWSLPMGIWIQYYFGKRWISRMALDTLLPFGIPLAILSILVVAVCSCLALKEGVRISEKNGLTGLLSVTNSFNGLNAVITLMAVFALVAGLITS